MKDSLKELKNLFPWFMDKSDSSNFSKSQWVTNRRFQRLDNDLFKIYQNFKLNKNLLIWKEQDEPYDYTINFVANFKNLKTVTCYKNDEVIYTKSFEYTDFIDAFNYSYIGSTLDDVDGENIADIIPQHKFKMEIETYEEYTLVKGWPENDEFEGNEFDHDISLDKLGDPNIPRKKYLIVDPELYPATEPPYNDRATEDDYHYMKRMLEYNLRLHDTPAPVLEIWKLYGIPATMENREKLLLKVFDIEKHPHFHDPNADGDGLFSGTLNEETGEIIPWTPEKWEHRDTFCDGSPDLGKYFFVKVSTKIPVKNQDIIFYFKFMNSLARELTEECRVDIYLNNRLLYSNIKESQKTIPSSEIPRDIENIFRVVGKDSNGEVIGSQDIIVNVRECNSGDFYVNPATGKDTNNGKTRSTPFKTIQKAVNSVNGDKNLVILLGGLYEINNPINITKNCTIMGCGSVLIENMQEDLFFTLTKDTTVTLQDFTLQYRGDICTVTDTTFTNHNGDGSLAKILLLFRNTPIIVITRLNLNFTGNNYVVGSSVGFTGTLIDKYGDAVVGETVLVSDNKSTISCTTDQNGVYTGSITAEKIGGLTLNAIFNGDEDYKSSIATATTTIYLRLRELLSDYDVVVMDLTFNENTKDWDYTTKPVSEINTLADLNGAILNLQYKNYDVKFERYYSYSTKNYLSKTDMINLRGLLVGIQYTPYDVQYMTAHVFGESYLTLNTSKTIYVVGETITFTGTLLDRYDDPITNKVVTVNNRNYTTNNNGEYTGTLTLNTPGSLILTADYQGDLDYEESHVSKTLTILISLASVLSDYTYVITDLQYDADTRDWDYIKKPISEITSLSDLNNCIMNLNKVGDNVQFERFHSTSTSENITKTELESLTGLLMAIVYDDYTIKYTKFK